MKHINTTFIIWSTLVLAGQECGLRWIPCSVSLAAGLASARMLCCGQTISWSPSYLGTKMSRLSLKELQQTSWPRSSETYSILTSTLNTRTWIVAHKPLSPDLVAICYMQEFNILRGQILLSIHILSSVRFSLYFYLVNFWGVAFDVSFCCFRDFTIIG